MKASGVERNTVSYRAVLLYIKEGVDLRKASKVLQTSDHRRWASPSPGVTPTLNEIAKPSRIIRSN